MDDEPIDSSISRPPSNVNSLRLRPYQKEALEAIVRGFRDFRRQLRVCPTGGGKTIEFAALAGHYQPGKTLIIAHRDELIDQARDKVYRFTGLSTDVEKAQHHASPSAPIVVASIQTLCRRQPFPPGHFRLIVVDEAHHVLSESFQQVLAHFNEAHILGVTATPDRGDKKLLSDFFENVAHETSLVDLIRDGYLSRVRVKTLPIKIDLEDVHVVAGDFDAGELGHVLEPYLGKIADIIAAEYANRKTLCFLPLCSLSDRFAALCRERGIKAEHVQGTSSDRPDVIRRLQTGETTLVSNAMLLTEGFDEPSIDMIVPLRPTKIRSLYAQQVGRGARIHPEKNYLLVLDFLWMTHRHNLIRPAALIAKDEEEANAVPGDGDLIENVEKFRADRLEKLTRELEALRERKTREFDLLEFAVALGDEDLSRFEPVSRWHNDPVTQGQREFITHCGISMLGIRNKGHASAVLDKLARRRAAGLATYKQVRALRKFGVENAHLLSFTDASKCLDKLFSSRRFHP
jgi:superfamily II DNA or RNA helicase